MIAFGRKQSIEQMEIEVKYLIIAILTIFSLPALSSEILSCKPEKLYFGDKFVINLKVPHGRDLIIQAPNDLSYEICFWYPKNSTNSPVPMFDYKKCASIDKVEIIAGVTETGGMNNNDKNFGPIKGVIFNETGKYKVIVSPNIETELPIISSCQIEYLGKR